MWKQIKKSIPYSSVLFVVAYFIPFGFELSRRGKLDKNYAAPSTGPNNRDAADGHIVNPSK